VDDAGDFARERADFLRAITDSSAPVDHEAVAAATQQVKEKARIDALAQKKAEKLFAAESKRFSTGKLVSEKDHTATIKKEFASTLKEWNERDKAGNSTTPKPKLGRQRSLTAHEKRGIALVGVRWRGVITACLKHHYPFPMVIPIAELAKMDDALAALIEDAPGMETMHELGAFLGGMLGDSFFRTKHFELITTNPAHASKYRDALKSAISWKHHGGNGSFEGMKILQVRSTNNAPSKEYEIMSQRPFAMSFPFWYRGNRNASGKKHLPPDWLDCKKSRNIILLAFASSPAGLAALMMGDGSLRDGSDFISVAASDFTDEEQQFICDMHAQKNWRDGTTGIPIHGGFPLMFGAFQERSAAHSPKRNLMLSAEALEDGGYGKAGSSFCRSATTRFNNLLATLPPKFRYLESYEHKLEACEDLNYTSLATIGKIPGAPVMNDHVIFRMVIDGKSGTEIQKYMQQFRPTIPLTVVRRWIVDIGAWNSASQTREKTKNALRITHDIRDIANLEALLQKIKNGGPDAARLGGHEDGGEKSLQLYKETVGALWERDGIVMDWDTYSPIYPARLTGTFTKFSEGTKNAQLVFFNKHRKSPPPLCAKLADADIYHRLRFVLSPPPPKPPTRSEALLAKGGWTKRTMARSDTSMGKQGIQEYAHVSGWCGHLQRAEVFQSNVEKLVAAGCLVEKHKDGKPVYMTAKNPKKKYRLYHRALGY